MQVTGPRLPCHKLAARFGREDMIERFLDGERTGFYLKVIREGEVAAGDAIRLLHREEGGVTVVKVTRACAKEKGNSDSSWTTHFHRRSVRPSGFRHVAKAEGDHLRDPEGTGDPEASRFFLFGFFPRCIVPGNGVFHRAFRIVIQQEGALSNGEKRAEIGPGAADDPDDDRRVLPRCSSNPEHPLRGVQRSAHLRPATPGKMSLSGRKTTVRQVSGTLLPAPEKGPDQGGDAVQRPADVLSPPHLRLPSLDGRF